MKLQAERAVPELGDDFRHIVRTIVQYPKNMASHWWLALAIIPMLKVLLLDVYPSKSITTVAPSFMFNQRSGICNGHVRFYHFHSFSFIFIISDHLNWAPMLPPGCSWHCSMAPGKGRRKSWRNLKPQTHIWFGDQWQDQYGTYCNSLGTDSNLANLMNRITFQHCENLEPIGYGPLAGSQVTFSPDTGAVIRERKAGRPRFPRTSG